MRGHTLAGRPLERWRPSVQFEPKINLNMTTSDGDLTVSSALLLSYLSHPSLVSPPPLTQKSSWTRDSRRGVRRGVLFILADDAMLLVPLFPASYYPAIPFLLISLLVPYLTLISLSTCQIWDMYAMMRVVTGEW